jgi:probable phosphoglycerate mutase
LPLYEQGKRGFLVLARHGNTFEPGEKVVWVGSRNDLALSSKGVEQAVELAEACKENGITFDTILSGPLLRTKDYANIVKNALKTGSTANIDRRLDEIDYGSWSGLTDEEVIERFGESAFKAWSRGGAWPQTGDWGSSPAKIVGEVKEFCSSMASKLANGRNVLAVTSNGRLKFFLTLIPSAFESAQEADTLKVKTGNVCVFSLNSGTDEYQCLAWNLAPKIALQSLISASQK